MGQTCVSPSFSPSFKRTPTQQHKNLSWNTVVVVVADPPSCTGKVLRNSVTSLGRSQRSMGARSIWCIGIVDTKNFDISAIIPKLNDHNYVKFANRLKLSEIRNCSLLPPLSQCHCHTWPPHRKMYLWACGTLPVSPHDLCSWECCQQTVEH